MNVFEKEMEEIPNEYRSLPFWSWNDKLDQEELKWQIRQMHQQGSADSLCMQEAD